MNGKYISSQEIIRNVYRDGGYNIDIPWQDAIEWASEALDLIGAPTSLQDKIASIDIQSFRGELPCDFHQMTQASVLLPTCRQIPMREATNTFHPVFTCNTNTSSTNGCCNPAGIPGSDLIDTTTPIGYDDDGNPTFNFMNDQNVSLNKATVSASTFSCNEPTYKLNDNFIFTNFECGAKVLIAYKAFPIDKDGFPLIPDNIKFKKAVAAYIRMMLDYILWRRNDLAADVYNHSEREWAWYVGAAGTAARIPSIDKMESWKNQMMHLIPRINQHSTFFTQLGSHEQLTFGRRRY